MRFKSVSVFPAFSKEILIEWELVEATAPGNYFFIVEKSGSPEGSFEKITPVPLVNKSFFIDKKTPLLTKENQIYYRVQVTDPTGKVLKSGPADLFRNLERRQWLKLRTITQKEILRLRKYVGIRALVLKRKHFGKLCTKCVDPVGGQVTDSDCSNCYATRFEGGYHTPIEAWIEVSPIVNDKALRPDGFGMVENFTSQARLVSYPLVTRGDVIVELESNRRFHVRAIQPFELRTTPVVQLVTISQIARTDIEYRFPIDKVIIP